MPPEPFDPRNIPDRRFRVPDLVQAVEGWRAFGIPKKLPHFGVPPKLYSVTAIQAETGRPYYWVPRRHNNAECPKCAPEDVPGQSCSCGFYSARTLEHLMSMGYHRYDAETNGMFHLIGQVANWGGVVPGDHGWRSQKSYPVKLFIPFEAHRLADALEEAYGVPVFLKNILKPVDGKRKRGGA